LRLVQERHCPSATKLSLFKSVEKIVRTKLLQKVGWSSILCDASDNMATTVSKIDWCNVLFSFDSHAIYVGTPLSQSIVRKAIEKNQVALAEKFPATLQRRFSKMYKI